MKTLMFALLALLGTSVAGAQTQTFPLTWDPPLIAADRSNAPTGIKIERKIGTKHYYTQIKSLGIVTTTQDSLAGGTRYCYRIRWFNAIGNGPYSTPVCATTAK